MSPTHQHEMPLEMIQRRPELAVELLALRFGRDIEGFKDARLESAELNERLPVEAVADSVVSVVTPHGSRAYVVVEVQRRFIEAKVWKWLAYVGNLAGRHRAPVALVVICLDEKTAAKCAEPLFPDYSSVILAPIVVGPAELRRWLLIGDIRASPEIATLAAVALNDLEVAVTVANDLVTRGDERGSFNYAYLKACLGEPIRKELEKMISKTELYACREDDYFTRPFWDAGHDAGHKQGLVQAAVVALHGVLAARGLELQERHRALVDACEDEAVVQRWVTRAVVAADADEVFA
ncbi:hypothetical protein [Nonomuraea longicatena]|uniref:Transposase n=1 Tax=Nonomuraea longicatena TaxID=83682 RepID=A0ABP4ASJ0_9ACTN